MRTPVLVLSALWLFGTAPIDRPLSAQAGKPGESKSLDWNQFRGPNRDGLSPDTGLLKQWPQGGPPLAWKTTGLGTGLSSVAVHGTRLYTMGEAGGKTSLIALNVADGKIAWSLPFGQVLKDDQGGAGPRSTPATDGTVVIAIGQAGEIVAAQAATGKLVWKADMKDFGGSKPGWWFSESPLLDGALVVFKPNSGGGTSVVALNKLTGKKVWESKKLKGPADYSSIAIAEMGKVRQYLVMTQKSCAGILPTNGALLWEGDFPGATAQVPTPVYHDGFVFVCSGYGVGCKAFKIAIAGNSIQASDAYSNKDMVNHTGGVVVVDGHVYGADENSVKCIEMKTGKVVWTDRSVGKGATTYADGHLIVRGQDGSVALVEAKPDAYKEKGRFKQPDRSSVTAWAYPVVFGGKLYLRDEDLLFCYDVKEK